MNSENIPFTFQGELASQGFGSLDVRISSDFEALRDAWLALEVDGVFSLYQRFNWMKSWYEKVGKPARVVPRLIEISLRGQPICILPMGLRSRGPFRILSWLGDTHTNFHMGLYSREFLKGAKPDDIRSLIDYITSKVDGLDVLELCCQPVVWQGHSNPFTFLPWQEAHNHAFALELNSDFNAVLDRKNGPRKRKKHRWQKNKLKDVGGAKLLIAETVEDVDRILDTSMKQMSRRFDRSGIWNRFEDIGVGDFFRELAIAELGKETPALKLYGLEIDGELQATFSGGVSQKHFSGCFISLTDGPYSKISPGELMIYLVIEDCVKQGLEVFDLGRGEERYKTSWCDMTVPMFDTAIALSKRGILFASYERTKATTKRLVRNNKTLWNFAKKVRARVYGRV